MTSKELKYLRQIRDAEREAENIKARDEDREKLDTLYETMKLKSDELLMVSKLTEEEKKSYEFAKRRAEILSTGAASPGELEAIFQNEMMAKRNDLEAEWKKTAPKLENDTATRVQALGDANKAIMQAMGDTKDKELIRAMKAVEDAIRNPNRDRGVILVEVQ